MPCPGSPERAGPWLAGGALIAAFLWMAGGAIPARRWDVWIAGYLLAGLTYVTILARLAARGWRAPEGWVFLGLPLLLRLIVLELPAGLTTDLARYRADALGWLTGRPPYWFPPVAVPGLEHASLPTLYPPLAELAFVLAESAGGSDRAFRTLFGLADFMGFVALIHWLRALERPTGLAWIWGLCPLAILEFAGVGHVDSLALALTLWSLAALQRERPVSSGLLLGAATMAKLAPAALFPMMVVVGGRRFALGFAALLAPFLIWPGVVGFPSSGGAMAYLTRWEFNGLVHGILSRAGLGGVASRLVCLALTIGAAVYILRAYARLSTRVSLIVYAAIMLTPTLHNWYIAWAIPFLAVEPRVSMMVLVLTGGLSYGVLVERSIQGVWVEGSWWWLEVGALAIALMIDLSGCGSGPAEETGKREREATCPED